MSQRPKPRTKYSGVYAVRHVASGAMYIGGSSDITGRYTHHRFTLRRGTNKTAALQKLWAEHGEDAFEFVTLERCEPAMVREREDAWIKAHPDCLNTAKSALTGSCSKPSETRKEAARKRWSRPDYRSKQTTTVSLVRAKTAARDADLLEAWNAANGADEQDEVARRFGLVNRHSVRGTISRYLRSQPAEPVPALLEPVGE